MMRFFRPLLPPALVVMWFLVTAAAALADSCAPEKDPTDPAGVQTVLDVFLIVAAIAIVAAVTLWRVKKRRERPLEGNDEGTGPGDVS